MAVLRKNCHALEYFCCRLAVGGEHRVSSIMVQFAVLHTRHNSSVCPPARFPGNCPLTRAVRLTSPDGLGGHYEPHYDHHGSKKEIPKEGDRLATFMMYLSNVQGGGYTAFPRLKVGYAAPSSDPSSPPLTPEHQLELQVRQPWC